MILVYQRTGHRPVIGHSRSYYDHISSYLLGQGLSATTTILTKKTQLGETLHINDIYFLGVSQSL